MTDKNGQDFAFYRVRGKGSIDYMDMDFTSEEILERRSYMRRILRSTPFDNSSNDILDGMRVWMDRLSGGYFIEDVNGYVFFLSQRRITEQESEFRRIRAMMPPEYMNLTSKDFDFGKYGIDMSKTTRIIQKFIMNYENFQDKNMGLYIYSGTKGSGKTMLACCILNEISKRYIGSVKFINGALRLHDAGVQLHTLRNRFGQGDGNAGIFIGQFRDAFAAGILPVIRGFPGG